MNKEYEGSITVEASMIFPLVLMLCFSLILVLFRLYDRNVVTEGRYMCALREDRYIENAEDPEDVREKKFKEEVLGRLILAESRVTALAENNRELSQARPVGFIRRTEVCEDIADMLFNSGKDKKDGNE